MKKGVFLVAAAMAVCAFAMPSAAAALSWSPAGTTQTITSTNLGFTATLPALGTLVSSCTDTAFTVNVANPASSTLEITNATFGGSCLFVFPSFGSCTMTETGTRFPWTMTALSTSDIRLDGVHIDATFEQTPGSTCPNLLVGTNLTITGNTTSGLSWNPVGDELIFNNVEGLVAHAGPFSFGGGPYTTRGTAADVVGPRLDLS